MSQGTITCVYETADNGSQQSFPDTPSGVAMTGPVSGIGAPTLTFLTDQVFNQHGELPRKSGHKFNSRDISLPVAFYGSDGLECLRIQRQISTAVNPFRGTGKLHVVRSDDPTHARYALCRYATGMQTAEHSTSDWGDAWVQCVLSFHCFDPFFYDSTPQVTAWRTAASSAIPFFPMFSSPTNVGPHFGSSTSFGVQDVANGGDMPVSPQWTINGPIVNPLITNNTTGEVMDFSADGGLTLTSSDVLTIDTSPGVMSVKLNGVSAFPKLTPASTLFALVLGVNAVQVTGAGVTGSTLVQLSFSQRWLSA